VQPVDPDQIQTGLAPRAMRQRFLLTESRAILFIALVGIVTMIPIMIWGIPAGADLANHYRFALPFYESIRSGHLYPGWLAESNNGFGDARFRFYPPGLYYFLAAFRLLTGWYSASVFGFTMLTVLGGLGTYFWARGTYPAKVAMWAGIIYTIAPYHLNELYQASLLSEYAACSVLPFVFAFVERICRRQGTANIAGLGVSYALLILLNLPLTVIGSFAVCVYALFLLHRPQLLTTILKLGLGIATGLAASAFFWTTVLAELSWIKGNSASPNIYYDYRSNFLFSTAALTNRNTWYANLLALAVLGLLLPAVILLKRKAAASVSRSTLRATAILTAVSFLMATALSRPLWAVLPKLREVQFPWRWLAITSLGGSILLAASIPKWKERWRNDFRPLHLVPALGVVLSVLFVITQVVWDSEFLSRQRFDSLLTDMRGSPSFKDWMPIWASDGVQPYSMKDRVDANSRTVTINDWLPQQRVFKIDNGPPVEARIRTFYYPLWSASTGERLLTTKPAPDGALLIAIPPDATVVTLKFIEPPRIQKARVLTSIGWLMIGALCIFDTGSAVFRGRLNRKREVEITAHTPVSR
jgi:6-pyruvoyl-tetrahydropterin synthase related domain